MALAFAPYRDPRYPTVSVVRLLTTVVVAASVCLAATPPKTNEVVQSVIDAVSSDSISRILEKLESFATRHTFSDTRHPTRGIGAARRWIYEQMSSYSPRLQVRYDSYHVKKKGRLQTNVEIVNVVGVLPGKIHPNRYVVVSAHYDSLNLLKEDATGAMPFSKNRENDSEKIAAADAPGVVDDGSGTASVMELARVMSRYEFDKSVVFVAFAGEEQGLVGSSLYAARAREDKRTIEAVFNNDIIGSDTAGDGRRGGDQVRVFSEGPEDSMSRQLARYIRRMGQRYLPSFKADLIFRHDRFGRGGDHTSFNQQGHAGVRFTTPMEHYSHQHTPTDLVSNASIEYTTRVTRLNASGLASLALAPASPVNTLPSGQPMISRGPSRYDAVLAWDCSLPAPDIAGYALVMRKTTSPYWEKEVFVGLQGEHRFRGMSIDEWAFGVKAIDRDGNESLVSPYVAPERKRVKYELY